VDVLSAPPTVAEREFLNSVIVHFQTGWWIARCGGLINLTELRSDARSFFSLPLPLAVWEDTKVVRNRRFVKFVEKAMMGNQNSGACSWVF